jgi:hypothetical protein
MSVIVKRKKANLYSIEGIKLYPGNTKLTDEQAELIFNTPAWKAQVAAGVMCKVEALSQDSKEETGDIAKMNAQDAIAVIQDTFAIPHLQEMLISEQDNKSRITVIRAIEDQIKEIKTIPKE